MSAFTADTSTLADMTIMSQEQRDSVQAEIGRVQRALGGNGMDGGDALGSTEGGGMNVAPSAIEGTEVGLPDADLLAESLRRDQDTLARNSVPDGMTGGDKNAVFQYYKEMSAKYAEGLLSDGQMRDPSANNVQQVIRHQEVMGQTGLALRNAIRILDPAEPFTVEAMRPVQPNYRNMGKWYDQFDKIQWAGDHEVELQKRALDDELFTRFMVMHAQGVDSSVIKTKLNINATLYSACVARFQDEAAALAGNEPEALIAHEVQPDPEPTFDLTLPEAPAQETPADAVDEGVQSMTDLELEMVTTHSQAMAQALMDNDTVTVKLVRETLDVSNSHAQAFLRGMKKSGVLVYDKSAKTYHVPAQEEV